MNPIFHAMWLGVLFAVATGVAFYTGRALLRALVRWAETEVARRDRLIRNADEEHRLVQEGDAMGVYGDFAPPAQVFGTGIWLTDKESHVRR